MKAHTTSKIQKTLLQKLKELDKKALELFYQKAYLDGMNVEHNDPLQVHLQAKLQVIETGIEAIEEELEVLNGR